MGLFSKRTKRVEGVTSADSSYFGLRSLALRTQVKDLNVGGARFVYGVMMEIGMGERTATLVCFASGDASLYYSNGGGMIGGADIPAVLSAATQMVSIGASLVDVLESTDRVDLPGDGRTGFVIITTSGLRSMSEETATINSNKTGLMPLYTAGHRVISAFIASESLKRDS